MKRAPRVAAVQDISGFGRCSMTVALPVLSAMGAQCCPLPTAYLSAHTAFPELGKAAFLDLTRELEHKQEHRAALGVALDAVYSGFIGSAGQIAAIRRFYERFRGADTVVLCDPVMGDGGRPYRTYTPDMCRAMGELAALADVITPNLTEAALLLGEEYADAPGSETAARAWLERLSRDGRRSVVLTGLSFTGGEIGADTSTPRMAGPGLPWPGRSRPTSRGRAICLPAWCWAACSGEKRCAPASGRRWNSSSAVPGTPWRWGPRCWRGYNSNRCCGS